MAWAVAGGVVLLALVLFTAISLVSNKFLGESLPGEYEMAEVGVAIAAFAFLPYCQLIGGNVSADIFTQRAGRRTVAILTMIGAVVAFLFAALLLWRMSLGMIDTKGYGLKTAILGFPIWIAFIPILVSLFLLVVASFISILEAGRDTKRSAQT